MQEKAFSEVLTNVLREAALEDPAEFFSLWTKEKKKKDKLQIF